MLGDGTRRSLASSIYNTSLCSEATPLATKHAREKMDTFRFRFDAKRLRLVPTYYLGFLIASSHCCNELAIFLPYILFEHEFTTRRRRQCAFILTRKFTVDRRLISKIVEYGELCSKFFKDHTDPHDLLLAEFSASYKPIAAKIKSAKWARILRNKISFHYDPQQANAALSKLDDAHPLGIIAGRIKGVTLFDFAEEIVSRPSSKTRAAEISEREWMPQTSSL